MARLSFVSFPGGGLGGWSFLHHFFPKDLPEDLARVALGELLHEPDSSWILVGCNSFFDELT